MTSTYRCQGTTVEKRTSRRDHTCLICSTPAPAGSVIAYFPRRQLACHWLCFAYEAEADHAQIKKLSTTT